MTYMCDYREIGEISINCSILEKPRKNQGNWEKSVPV